MEENKLLAYENRKANKTTTWVLFLFLGWSYGSLNKIGLQILFYITLGGLGIWTLVRLFNLNSSIRNYNQKIASELNMTTEEMKVLNLL